MDPMSVPIMPELPDVEVYKRYLDATTLHQRIDRVRVSVPELLDGTTPQALGRVLHARRIESSRRHGKYLFAETDRGAWLVLHFGMTGFLRYFQHGERAPQHACLEVRFANGFHLAYAAPRKLGRIALARDPCWFVRSTGLGPDALAVDRASFRRLARSRRGLKSWLTHQQTIAGIGNVYSDEILFQARLDPRRRVEALGVRELDRLYRSMRRVLTRTISTQADPSRVPRSFLLPHRGMGGRCPRCRGRLRREPIAGRSAWYCPRCQRGH